MLDLETVDYILKNYSHFMSLKEAAAMKHQHTLSKYPDVAINSDKWNLLIDREFISQNREVLELLECGNEKFRVNIAQRILNDYGGRIYFNVCPKCGGLLRTPSARQCRYCFYDWHDKVKGSFRIMSTVKLTSSDEFFVLGEIVYGDIKVGMQLDLTVIGLPVRPKIFAIEYASQRDDFGAIEQIGLGLAELSSSDKEYLKLNSPFLIDAPIEE
jgi:hypothetical protein